MSDQSASTLHSELKDKIMNKIMLTDSEFEEVKISSRSVEVSKELTETEGFIENLVSLTFTDNLNSEGLKAIINIARNEPTSCLPIAQFAGSRLNNLFENHEQMSMNEKFLLGRLLFLITIEAEGAKKVFESSEGIEKFIKETFSSSKVDVTDDSELGQVVVELLRYRFNLVRYDLIDHQTGVNESNDLCSRIPASAECVNIIGSCLNFCLGKGPENILIDIEIGKFMEIFDLMIKMYVESSNKDYMAQTLLIAIKLVETHRSDLRKRYLPSNRERYNVDNWKKLLVVSDTSISFLTGEFLLKLCKENVARLLRHAGFESTAGFLYSKGILKGGPVFDCESEIDPEGDSSDEEFFLNNAAEPAGHTPLIPETQEEADELEYLMNKITEYNSKST